LKPATPRGTFARPSHLNTVLFAAMALGLAGCAAIVAPPAPTGPAKEWESSELIKSLGQRREQVRSLRALARVDYSGPDGRSGFQEAVLVQRPDRLRLETLSFLGSILIVTVNDKEIVGYHPREGIYVRGQRSKANLFRYTKIPLELDEITTLLVGLPPVDVRAPQRQEGNSLIFSHNGQKKDALAFESEQPVPTKWERFNGAGAVEVRAQFADYVSTPSGLFPSTILVEAPLQRKKLEIRYQEPELNASLPADLFSQEKPANVKELPIEAIGG
jgi:hypothetical protein